jgi:hypothetical protein
MDFKMTLAEHFAHLKTEYQKNFGNEDSVFKFSSPEDVKTQDENLPKQLEVWLWRPDKLSDLTTFATAGMSYIPQGEKSLRTELHFSIQGKLQEEEENYLAQFLANLSLHPFLTQNTFDWWSTLHLTGIIPTYDDCNSVLLHPPFHEKGWAQIDFKNYNAKILNVIPIPESELLLARQRGIEELQKLWERAEINTFERR